MGYWVIICNGKCNGMRITPRYETLDKVIGQSRGRRLTCRYCGFKYRLYNKGDIEESNDDWYFLYYENEVYSSDVRYRRFE